MSASNLPVKSSITRTLVDKYPANQTEAHGKNVSRRLWITAGGISVGGLPLGYWLGLHITAVATAIRPYDDVLIALGTVALAGVTWALYRATNAIDRGGKETLRHLRRSSHRELRAYVMVDEVKVATVASYPHLVGYRFHVKNFGRTPARNVRIQSEIFLGPVTRSTPFPDIRRNAPVVSAGPLGPGATFYHSTAPHEYATAEVARIEAGEQPYVFGEITYADSFHRSHTTRFRFTRDPGTRELSVCDEGNDAD